MRESFRLFGKTIKQNKENFFANPMPDYYYYSVIPYEFLVIYVGCLQNDHGEKNMRDF